MAKNLQNEQLEEMGKRRRQGRIMKRVFIGAAVCVAFFAIYALIWLGQYLGIRRRLREVNRALGARRERV